MAAQVSKEMQERMLRNLEKTCEIIDAVFTLKLAYYKSLHPGVTQEQARLKIFQDIVDRKNRQWMSYKD